MSGVFCDVVKLLGNSFKNSSDLQYFVASNFSEDLKIVLGVDERLGVYENEYAPAPLIEISREEITGLGNDTKNRFYGVFIGLTISVNDDDVDEDNLRILSGQKILEDFSEQIYKELALFCKNNDSNLELNKCEVAFASIENRPVYAAMFDVMLVEYKRLSFSS